MPQKLLSYVVFAALVFVASAAASSAVETSVGPGMIRITNVEARRTVVDLGRKGPSPGDMYFVRALLYNKGLTPKALGHSEISCTSTGDASDCSGTYFLPKGKLVVGGVVRSSLLFELAVLGGTGIYDDARGTLTVTTLALHPRRALLVFRLTG